MYKDFCGAYNQAPIAESLSPQLAESFGTSRLLGQPKQLCKQVQTTAVGIRRFKPKPIPMPLTPEQELGSEATPVRPSKGDFESMARRRFQDPEPKRSGHWWYVLYWQDVFLRGDDLQNNIAAADG